MRNGSKRRHTHLHENCQWEDNTETYLKEKSEASSKVIMKCILRKRFKYVLLRGRLRYFSKRFHFGLFLLQRGIFCACIKRAG